MLAYVIQEYPNTHVTQKEFQLYIPLAMLKEKDMLLFAHCIFCIAVLLSGIVGHGEAN